ncbi:nuclear transport factor 2 family protein [Streptomyces sp. cg40]|uniref:nuclear transport factor 2 family protein n=1 Tax=Streptomyces sp. cg40 TaxID=3419764 RepID=UPI003CFC28BC
MDISADLALRIDRLEAAQAVQNLMGKYEYLHSAYQNAEIVKLFAERDDIVIDMPFGRWNGRDAARRCFGVMFEEELTARDRRGELAEHTLTTPVIEVAKDGQTAKAVWNSPGHEAHTFFWLPDKPRIAFWYWCRYSVDFVKTDEGWRIWHLHVYQTWASEVNSSVVSSEPPTEPPTPNGWAAPDEALTLVTKYSAEKEPELIPVPPEPYDSYVEHDYVT